MPESEPRKGAYTKTVVKITVEIGVWVVCSVELGVMLVLCGGGVGCGGSLVSCSGVGEM